MIVDEDAGHLLFIPPVLAYLCCVVQFFQAMYSYETNKVYRALKDLNNNSEKYTKVKSLQVADRFAAWDKHTVLKVLYRVS